MVSCDDADFFRKVVEDSDTCSSLSRLSLLPSSDFAKIESGHLGLEAFSFNMRSLVDEVLG